MFRRATAALLGAAAIALMAPAANASTEPDAVAQLNSGERLTAGQTMKSGDSVLVMQGDGNLVMYLESSTGVRVKTALWSTGTYGNPGAYAYMQPDGNLVVYKQGGTAQSDALWSTGTWNSPGGYLVLYRGAMTLWPGPSGGKGWESRTGLAPAVGCCGTNPESYLTSARNVEGGQWIQSNTVWLVNQADGNLVLYRKRDGAALWSSGTWNRGSSMLVLSESQWNPALFLRDNAQRVTWSISVKGSSDLRGVVQDDGNFVIYNSAGAALWSTGTWGKA
ncbi:hypothetical protein AMK19_30015 [Kitasatospora sp. CB01950]|nr:hypothetical protein AMK19_30015 [Kitasatospora sp. CB01950]